MNSGEQMRTLWIGASPKGDAGPPSQMAQAYLEGQNHERFSVWDNDALRFGRAAAIADFAPLFGEGTPLQLILTRSRAYDGRHPELQEFPRPYLEYVFGMLGDQVETLVFESTTRWTPEERADAHRGHRARTGGRSPLTRG